MNFQLILLSVLTTARIKKTAALKCYNCNATWAASTCLKNSRIETCPYRHPACLTVDTMVTTSKGEKSTLYLRQCIPKYKCRSARPCKDIKVHLLREKPDLFVDNSCQPQCCWYDLCNHPVPTLLPNVSHQFPPTSKPRKSRQKCFALMPELISQLPRKKPREKNCSKNEQFDSCFTLRAQVVTGNIPGDVTETIEWIDCAISMRDCHAITNRCTHMKHLAGHNGAYLVNCSVSCCSKELCNRAMTIPYTTNNIKGNNSREVDDFPTFLVVLLAVSLVILL
ncbi:PREDICTED: uncharacterized protein LOC107347390 [Acropora digitifera]|uniref:uncharacterized protein LOC107347390 n=1 Tax=Acropora digitifera TaxID=70779 RepID=UPI00077AD8A3|nr:PREDICTED: uncharacterized protein LOC107347390 [Acropora digitifera]XP_015768769.1 PREDICTED: uncharacterized protein LOC107347390 [Acropora digitifera]